MNTIFDYLYWRGDLTIKQSNFNEIDNLILSRLSYIPFENIVSDSYNKKISIYKAAQLFLADKDAKNKVILSEDFHLISEISKTPRFSNMHLFKYVNKVDTKEEKQFSALIVELSKNYYFISYRGTDNTLIGWKEDFNMSFMTTIPSQKDALIYLEDAINQLYGKFIIGGHSKGGNLAVYSAIFCSKKAQKKIIEIYSNDGPGFDNSILKKSNYSKISEKIHTFVPQSSVVGMLLEHEENYTIVHSSQTGLLQHDLYSWGIENTHLIYLDTVTNGCKFIDTSLKDWLTSLTYEERVLFFNTLYDIIATTNATTIEDLSANWYKNAITILKSIKNMNEPMKNMMSTCLSLLFKSMKNNISILLPQKLNTFKTK